MDLLPLSVSVHLAVVVTRVEGEEEMDVQETAVGLALTLPGTASPRPISLFSFN